MGLQIWQFHAIGTMFNVDFGSFMNTDSAATQQQQHRANENMTS